MKDEDERRMKDGVGNNEKTKKKQLKRQKKKYTILRIICVSLSSTLIIEIFYQFSLIFLVPFCIHCAVMRQKH